MEHESNSYRDLSVTISEAILGVPLYVGSRLLPDIPDGRRDIREFAHRYTLDALEAHRRRPRVEDSPATTAEIDAVASLENIRYLAGQVAVANSLYRSTLELPEAIPRADKATTTRARLQAQLTDQLYMHAQTVPRYFTNNLHVPLGEMFDDDGLAVIAPTGAGKTVLQAEFLRRSGIGQTFPGESGRRRAVVATSTRKLVQQFLGISGDNTFREFLGEDISVTAEFHDQHDQSGDVVLTTPNSIGKLDLSRFTKLLVDEGHTGLSPKMHEHLSTVGIRPYLFTATPMINKKRDLRHIYESIEVGTLRTWIEAGALNPTRLLSFEYDKDPAVMAAQLAAKYIKKDRRVVIYSRSGESSLESRLVAQGINQLLGTPVAYSVGKHEDRSEEYEAAFARGSARALCTCRRLREGWNEDVDVAILIGPNFSMKDVLQKMGRTSRPGAYMSEVLELIPRKRPEKRQPVSIWGAVGLEYVSSDVVIATGGMYSIEDYLKTQAKRPDVERVLPAFTDPAEFSKKLQDSLITDTPLRSIVMGPRGRVEQPPAAHTDVVTIAQRLNVPVLWLQYKLDKAKINYVGVIDDQQDEGFLRWYNDSELEKYLEETSPPELAEAGVLSRVDIAALCGISMRQVDTYIDNLELQPVSRLGHSKHRKLEHFLFSDVLMIYVANKTLPVADPTDVPLGEVRALLGNKFIVRTYSDPRNNITPRLRSRNPIHGLKGSCLHITAQEKAKMLALYQEIRDIPAADDTVISLQQIALESEATHITVRLRMTPEEKAAVEQRRVKGMLRGDVVPKAIGNVIIERLKPWPLPPHLVPSHMYEQRILKLSRFSKWRRDTQEEVERLRIIGKSKGVICLTWQQLASLEQEIGTKPNVVTIDYDKVVRNADDRDPERVAYSQSIQKLYFPGHVLLPREEALQPPKPKLSAPAVPARLANGRTTGITRPPVTSIDGVQVRNVQPSSTKSQSAEAVPRKVAPAATAIPEHYVNVIPYLKKEGLDCEPRLLRWLVRRERLDELFEDKQTGDLWATELTVLTLEDMIKTTFPLADIGMETPKRIAQEFAQFDVNERHIVHLAQQLTTSLHDYVAICRERTTDNTPGALSIHYTPIFVSAIKKHIGLLRDTGRINTLVRFGYIHTPPPLKKRG